MARFDLVSEGILYLNRLGGLITKTKVSRDPLSGLLDGSNKTFHTSYAPISSAGSLYVYVNGSPVSGSADLETGEIVLGSAPAVQPEATYVFMDQTIANQLSYLIQGFNIMEGLWNRNLRLVDATGNFADETSANIYPDNGNVIGTLGADPFNRADRSLQLSLYMACTRLGYLMTLQTSAVGTDYVWRETVRGMTVDKSKRPANMDLAIARAEQQVKDILQVAQNSWYADGSNLGAWVSNPATMEYAEAFEWQTASKEDNNAALFGTRRGFPLNV